MGPAATCRLCHEIDAAGSFRLIGVDSGKEIQATPDMVTRMEPYYRSWATSDRLDRTHSERGVVCSTCHEKAFPDASVKKDKCFACHGSYEQVAEQAPFHWEAIYPHFGDGQPVECNQCHKAHEASVNACNMCHSFGEEVP